MSFLYPRTISVFHPAAQSGEGALPYGGQTEASDAAVAAGLRCSIQERREGQKNDVGLPGDGTKPTWYIFVPKSACALGVIHERFILVDDIGDRYRVVAAYWDSLGYRVTAEKLQA